MIELTDFERHRLLEIAYERCTGGERSSSIREFADKLVSAGNDDPYLIEILTEPNLYSENVVSHFDSFLQSHGLPNEPREILVEQVAELCRRVLTKEISPRAFTADLYWQYYRRAADVGLNLGVFVYLDDYYDELPRKGWSINRKVLDQAKKFLADNDFSIVARKLVRK